MQCIARCKSNPFKQCSLKQCENKLCKKHLADKTVVTINQPLFDKNEIHVQHQSCQSHQCSKVATYQRPRS